MIVIELRSELLVLDSNVLHGASNRLVNVHLKIQVNIKLSSVLFYEIIPRDSRHWFEFWRQIRRGLLSRLPKTPEQQIARSR